MCHGAGAAGDMWPEELVLLTFFRESLLTNAHKNIIQSTFGLKQHMGLIRSLLSNPSFPLGNTYDY